VGNTAWLISVVINNTEVLEKLWKWAEKKLRTKELKNELLLAGVTVNFMEEIERWKAIGDLPTSFFYKLITLQMEVKKNCQIKQTRVGMLQHILVI